MSKTSETIDSTLLLNEQEISQFHRDGFIVGPKVINDDEIDASVVGESG